MVPTSYTGKLPLDSAHWWSIDVAFERRIERTRYTGHALRDLEDAMAQGRLRCMARSVADPSKCKLPAPAIWARKYRLEWSPKYGVFIQHRVSRRHFGGWSFYIWLPDLEALWPAEPKPASVPTEKKTKTRLKYWQKISKHALDAVEREWAQEARVLAAATDEKTPLPTWLEIVAPHFDAETKRNGPYRSLGSLHRAIESELKARKKAVPDKRNIARGLNKHRPNWFTKRINRGA